MERLFVITMPFYGDHLHTELIEFDFRWLFSYLLSGGNGRGSGRQSGREFFLESGQIMLGNAGGFSVVVALVSLLNVCHQHGGGSGLLLTGPDGSWWVLVGPGSHPPDKFPMTAANQSTSYNVI